MVVNRSNLHVGQTVFFVHKEYTSLVFRRKKMQLMVEFYALQEKMQKNIF